LTQRCHGDEHGRNREKSQEHCEPAVFRAKIQGTDLPFCSPIHATPHFVAFFVPRIVVYASSQDFIGTALGQPYLNTKGACISALFGLDNRHRYWYIWITVVFQECVCAQYTGGYLRDTLNAPALFRLGR
jgi:hypothetical protein